MNKKWAVLMACLVLLAAPGCSAAEEQPAAEQAETTGYGYAVSATPEVTVEQILSKYNSARHPLPVEEKEAEDTCPPLTLVRCACQLGDSYVIFPKVEGEVGQIINDAICSAVMNRAGELGIPVFADYRVEYNRNGIFSMRMFLYDMYGESGATVDCVPLTFSSETGQLYRISDLFDSESELWRGRIPDIITAQAEDYQMVLLGDVLPISDDRSFYITDEAVVIMYDLYEIATYSAGEPSFEIAVGEIAECIDDSSVLNAMLQQEEQGNESATEETSAPSIQPEPTPVPEETLEPGAEHTDAPAPAAEPTQPTVQEAEGSEAAAVEEVQ